jgi:hypothetical protein
VPIKYFQESIYSITSGYLIRDWKFNGRQSLGHFNTEDVEEGIYFLSLVSENGEILKTMKLVIIR